MPPASPETQIRSAVAALVAEHGLALEDVRLRRRGRETAVEITLDLADGPGSLDLDRLGDVSREISKLMDVIDVVDGAYTLEIGTPGAARELTTPRHFRRAEGRLVAFVLTADATPDAPAGGAPERLVARVVGADEEAVTVRSDGADTDTRRIPFDAIDRAVVEVELR
ncbi:ribosome maturation factor RimP [Salana multivorans]|uniref:Ribosome maturation factor RimP n=1 Tax=Salana multivorans TaxID=120377 RepID=A0A3N2D2B7_9MICO|nr:ribosome maturation factor RimP [Salana multivorans]ROR93913.1 ribosome maturation factor RimP [Salana multivorans]